MINEQKIGRKLENGILKNYLKEMNSIMSDVIIKQGDDSDQSASLEKKMDELIQIFSTINQDIDSMKYDINNLLDSKAKDLFEEENSKLEIAFNLDMRRNSKSQSEIGNTFNNVLTKQANDSNFNSEDLKCMLKFVKKENEDLKKEIDNQESHICAIKRELNKIQQFNN